LRKKNLGQATPLPLIFPQAPLIQPGKYGKGIGAKSNLQRSMNPISCSLAAICLSASLTAEVTLPLDTFALNTPYHRAKGSMTLELPEGWKHTEHNGAHYLIGGSDVYGSVSLAYSKLGVKNFSSQFGTPTPPKSEIGGVTVYHQVKDGSASFLRDLGDGWSVRASLSPYEAFKGKDPTAYAEAMARFIATASFELPNADTVAATEGAIVMELDGQTFTFKPAADVWTYRDGVLAHKSGVTLTAKHLFDNEGLSQLNVFKKAVGTDAEVWAKLSMPQVIGSVAAGRTHACAQVARRPDGDHYVLLSASSAADEALKKDLTAFLQSVVKD
jgi:hypothetical protein